MKKYEYLTLKADTCDVDMSRMDDRFNGIGSKGWELVTAANDDGMDNDGDTYTKYIWFSFKRPYKDTKGYEYKTFRKPVDNVSLSLRRNWLNDFGAKGWELATSVCENSQDEDGDTYTENIWYTFKRQLGSQKQMQFRIEKAYTTNVDLSLRNKKFSSFGCESWRVIAAAPDDCADKDGDTYTEYIWYTFTRQNRVFKKYDYLSVLADTDDDFDTINNWFNKLGNSGWELAVASSDNAMDDDGDTYTEDIWYTFIRAYNSNKRFEYYTTKISTEDDYDNIDKLFDQLGANGWELVTSASDNTMDDDGDTYTGTIWYTFKRML